MTDQVKPEAQATVEQPVVDTEMAAKLAEMEATLAEQNKELEAFRAKEEAEAAASLDEHLSGFEFAAEHKEGLTAFFGSVSEENQALMSAVLGSAQAALTSQKEASDAEMAKAVAVHEEAIAEANGKVVDAEAAAEAAREEFGSQEQQAEEAQPRTS